MKKGLRLSITLIRTTSGFLVQVRAGLSHTAKFVLSHTIPDASSITQDLEKFLKVDLESTLKDVGAYVAMKESQVAVVRPTSKPGGN